MWETFTRSDTNLFYNELPIAKRDRASVLLPVMHLVSWCKIVFKIFCNVWKHCKF